MTPTWIRLTAAATVIFLCAPAAEAQVFFGNKISDINRAKTASVTQGKQSASAVADMSGKGHAEGNTDGIRTGAITEEDIAAVANIPPAAMTPEQKIAAEAPVMKLNKIIARNVRPEEARRMVEAANTFEKIKIRRINRQLAPERQLEFEPNKIDEYDRTAIKDFLDRNTLDNQLAKPLEPAAEESAEAPVENTREP